MIHCGDALTVSRTLESESVQCCVTSPPYWGLRSYGTEPQAWGGDAEHAHLWGEQVVVNATNHVDKRRWNHTRNGRDEEQPVEKRVDSKSTDIAQGQFCECGAWLGSLGLEPTPELFVQHIVAVFREVRRVLRKDGTCWLNLGDSYATAAGKVGNCPGGGEQGERFLKAWGHAQVPDGKNPQAGIPTFQPNRMPLPGLKPKDLIGIPWRVALALQADGWWLRSDIIWAKKNPMPESVSDRCTRSHEYIFMLTKSARYYYDAAAIYEPLQTAAKENYPARATILGRGEQDYNGAGARNGDRDKSGGFPPSEAVGRNKRSVWTIGTSPLADAHFATFPLELAETCILAGSAPGDTICDPFCGAGTTLMAAIKHGRKGIGIELNPAYVELAKKRIERHYSLFAVA